MNDIKEYRNPYYNQYVAPYGYAFYKDGRRLGRIIWTNNVDGIYTDKDENG